ncbi:MULTISPECIES: hypothetical protein [Rhizobium]|uniref:Uncharacterized protein n=1 Tax=Rhizobium binae TaxID=1138190 RepID=A0ABV2MPD0_9HYPH|nr:MULTISPECIES: hypothetical protein [Rhizobium]NKL51917.1 hypothetical protein [Rhizobium leguminosarum bv. viciae]MBX4910911.1 hypothetical protein [Rhizobium bangladeshense]MBX4938036.1 hypothetical protein [Rhizobium binae]MBX4944400.1 hypothetical protein [Rhizobium binae]MBX4949184.1 hypothetical protein [Rhizobium binae]
MDEVALRTVTPRLALTAETATMIVAIFGITIIRAIQSGIISTKLLAVPVLAVSAAYAICVPRVENRTGATVKGKSPSECDLRTP